MNEQVASQLEDAYRQLYYSRTIEESEALYSRCVYLSDIAMSLRSALMELEHPSKYEGYVTSLTIKS